MKDEWEYTGIAKKGRSGSEVIGKKFSTQKLKVLSEIREKKTV